MVAFAREPVQISSDVILRARRTLFCAQFCSSISLWDECTRSPAGIAQCSRGRGGIGRTRIGVMGRVTSLPHADEEIGRNGRRIFQLGGLIGAIMVWIRRLKEGRGRRATGTARDCSPPSKSWYCEHHPDILLVQSVWSPSITGRISATRKRQRQDSRSGRGMG